MVLLSQYGNVALLWRLCGNQQANTEVEEEYCHNLIVILGISLYEHMQKGQCKRGVI